HQPVALRDRTGEEGPPRLAGRSVEAGALDRTRRQRRKTMHSRGQRPELPVERSIAQLQPGMEAAVATANPDQRALVLRPHARRIQSAPRTQRVAPMPHGLHFSISRRVAATAKNSNCKAATASTRL